MDPGLDFLFEIVLLQIESDARIGIVIICPYSPSSPPLCWCSARQDNLASTNWFTIISHLCPPKALVRGIGGDTTFCAHD